MNSGKIQKNILLLKEINFQVIIVWECELKKSPESIINDIDSKLKNQLNTN